MAISPSLEAGSDARAPLKDPTGVRAAAAITIVEASSLIGGPSLGMEIFFVKIYRMASRRTSFLASIGRPKHFAVTVHFQQLRPLG
jgi:hypothetical protein